MIPVVLVRVQSGEVIDCSRKLPPLADVGADRGGVAGACMGLGEGLAASAREFDQDWSDEIDAGDDLHVAELAHIVVPSVQGAPADENVGGALQGLLLQGWRADQIVVAGDSAGGGLSVMLAQRLRDAGQALPCCLLLLSPYVDYTFAQSSHTLRASRDPMLSVSVLKRGIAGLLAQQPLTARQLSPVFADLSGLPPLCIQMGSEEILFDDAQLLGRLADQAGTPVTLEVYQGLWHDFQLFAPQLAIGQRAVQQLARWARTDWSAGA